MATDAPDTLRELFFDADRRVGQGLATYGELDATAFDGLETIEDVSADATAMDLLAASEAYQEVARSVVAMEAQAADATAMDAVSASQTARDAIGTSGVGYDAIAQVAMAIGKYAAGIAGLTPTNYADIDAVASDANAMDAVSASSAAMDAVSASSTAMDAVSASSTAMDAVSASQTARDAIGTSGVGYDAIAQVAMAIGKYAAGIAALTPTNYADIDAVASDADAMDAVSTSSTAMDAVSTSSTAMDAVSTSSTAMDAVSASSTAMDAVSASSTAMDAVSDSETARTSIAASSAAVSTLNAQASDEGVGELIGDGGPNSGGSPVYGRSRGVYIEKLIHDIDGGNSGSATIWIDYGDEVKQYNSSGGTLEVSPEQIAFQVYHQHEFSSTGIERVTSYEW